MKLLGIIFTRVNVKVLAIAGFQLLLLGSVLSGSAANFAFAAESNIGSIGPVSYTSFIDNSPFAALKSERDFHIEDFEDSSMNVPASIDVGQIFSNPNTDSVDEDDKLLDGSGSKGKSWLIYGGIATITFSSNSDGSYPTYAGLVITDSYGATSYTLEAYGTNGRVIKSIGPVKIGDDSVTGTTGEDTFLGFTGDTEISSLIIRAAPVPNHFEMDHLQFGFDKNAKPSSGPIPETTEETDNEPVDKVNKNPVALISAPQGPYELNKNITFRATGSSDADGDEIVDYAWDFGDKKSSNGDIVQHIYLKEGIFTLKLTVTDERGGKGERELEVEVTKIIPPDPTIVPIAKITLLGSLQKDVGEPVSLSGTKSEHPNKDKGSEIEFYGWDFGDGKTDEGPTVQHVYDAPGKYSIELTVRDDKGITTSSTTSVEINPKPLIHLFGSPIDVATFLGIAVTVIGGVLSGIVWLVRGVFDKKKARDKPDPSSI